MFSPRGDRFSGARFRGRHTAFLRLLKGRAASVRLVPGTLTKVLRALLMSQPGRFQKGDVYVALDFLDFHERAWILNSHFWALFQLPH